MNSLLVSEKYLIFATVNAGVHITYSMFDEILEKSPNKRVEVEKFSTSYFIYGNRGGTGRKNWRTLKDILIYKMELIFVGISFSSQ